MEALDAKSLVGPLHIHPGSCTGSEEQHSQVLKIAPLD